MKRERALQQAEKILSALDQGQEDWPLSLVREVYVFGSFARGSLLPHDLDIDIEHERDRRWGQRFADCLARGRSPYPPMKRLLVGSRRSCQIQFNFRDGADFEMTLLWRKGDSLETARARLYNIPADPDAGRAPRDAMLPQFEGLDHWVPRPHREILAEAVSRGAITLERLVLDDSPVRSRVAREHIDKRWSSLSPLHRAARAVVTEWERSGIDPGHAHLHGEDIRDINTPYFAGFQLRYFTHARCCFLEYGGTEWLEVVRPTRTKPIDCLRIIPADLEVLADCLWGDYLDRRTSAHSDSAAEAGALRVAEIINQEINKAQPIATLSTSG